MSLDLKHTEASFLPSPIDWLYLRVADMPRCRDLAIFVRTTDNRQQTTDNRQQTDKPIALPLLRMRAHGVIMQILVVNGFAHNI